MTQPGFYTSHDGETHAARIAQYYLALTDFQIPPRFATTFYQGLGSPIFVYIYPLPYLLGSLIHIVGITYVDTFKTMMGLGFIFSGIFTYIWFKEFFKNTSAAFLGALFYMWAPYRFSLIYVRGSLSEVLAYTFVPLTFYSLTKLFNTQKKVWIAASAISYAMILLSQNLVAIITTPVIVLYILSSHIFQRSFNKMLMANLSLIWGGLMASITYLPSLFERKFVRFDETIQGNFVNHFVTLKQLIYSPWGYGFDLPGTVNDQLSFQIGITHLIVVTISTFLVLITLFRIKVFFNFKTTLIASIFLAMIAVSIILMTNSTFSVYLWQHTVISKIIDIQWRLLGLVALSCSFLTALAAKAIKPKIIFLLLIALVLFLNRNHLKVNLYIPRDDHFFSEYTGTATQYNEFTPKWRQTTRVPIGFDFNIKTQVLEGEADIQNVFANSKKVSFNVDVTSPRATVVINKFYFPGVKVNLNGKELKAFQQFTVTDTNTLSLDKDVDNSGLVAINIDKGSHFVSLLYQETTLRLLADLLSLTSISLALGVIVILSRKTPVFKPGTKAESREKENTTGLSPWKFIYAKR